MLLKVHPHLESLSADPLWERECCKTEWFWRCDRIWNHYLQILSGSWNAVKQNGFEGATACGITICRSSLGAGMLQNRMVLKVRPRVESLSADPLWERECCKAQWFWRCGRIWNHYLQILSGSGNAVKQNGFEGATAFGITICRSSLGAGMR